MMGYKVLLIRGWWTQKVSHKRNAGNPNGEKFIKDLYSQCLLYNHHQYDSHGNRCNFSQIDWRLVFFIDSYEEKFMTFIEAKSKIREILRRLWGQQWWIAAITTTRFYRFLLHIRIRLIHARVKLLHMMSSHIHDVNASSSLNKLFIRQGMLNISYYLTKWRSWFTFLD